MAVGTRELHFGPSDSGPTGPSRVTVLPVPAVATHINLTLGQFPSLQFAVQNNQAVRISADGANVYYHWSSQATGIGADPAMSVFGPTGANQSAVAFNGQHLVEMAPAAQGLCIVAPGGGGTAMMRISRIG